MANENVLPLASVAAEAADRFARAARTQVRSLVSEQDKLSSRLLDRHQRAAHGYAWVETTVAALGSMVTWAKALADEGCFGQAEIDVVRIVFGEYLCQMVGGLPMSQNESVRPRDLGLANEARALADDSAVAWFIAHGNTPETRARLAAALVEREYLAEPSGDDTLAAIRSQFRRFVDQRILPFAQGWHLANELIPDELVTEMADLGTFGVCIDPEYGGLGLGKLAMCVVTEELSRGWLGVGSIGTRSEIAGELIGSAGTPEQKLQWLPGIASGAILPVAVFTEPGNGSDLGSLKARATQASDGSWRVTGNKTWITHAARSDVMTLLARTNPNSTGYDGLSMFIAPKPRGTKEEPFPAPGMAGGEIEVLGYRGMREYEIGFSDFVVPADALLGGIMGNGFRQLMQTFEGARIQTAARAVGVAFRAYELARAYAIDRVQFGRPIVQYPRVADKLAVMYAETIAARELTYFAAREKDLGHRCDIQAGMAKLIAARVAWVNADAAVQIHGGNGYALEFEISRVLCDARILNIFEGAAEIQAHVVARGKLA